MQEHSPQVANQMAQMAKIVRVGLEHAASAASRLAFSEGAMTEEP